MNISRLIPLFLAGLSPAVQAVTLPPFPSQVSLPGTSVAAQPHLAGTVVEDLLTPFGYRAGEVISEGAAVTWDLTGTVQSQVVRAVDGSFDFYWRVLPDAQYVEAFCTPALECGSKTLTSPNVPLSDFHVGSFNVPEVRADWRSDGPGEAAPRMGGIGSDGTVNFQFGEVTGDPPEFYTNSTLRTGIDSYFLFIDTDARAYSKSGVFSLSTDDQLYVRPDLGGLNGRSELYATFAPAPIPEPATWALMLAGLAGLAGLSRRRHA